MPIPSASVSWGGSLTWLVALALAAFLVSWLVADRLRANQVVYVTALTVVTAAFTAGYVAWAGIDIGAFVADNWLWAVAVGLLAGAIPALAATRMQATAPAAHGLRRAEKVAGDGVLYAVDEGLLLSTLPALMAWQMVHAWDWSGAAGATAAVVLPLLASVAVIVVHHLGYPEFRKVPQLAVAVVACGLLTGGFLVTGSILTAPIGHVLMHTAAVWHGTELPPHHQPTATA